LSVNLRMQIIQDRIIVLQNSVKFLEIILHKLRDQVTQFPIEKIQKRIKSYKQELQLHENILT
jgi:hypothetical protein